MAWRGHECRAIEDFAVDPDLAFQPAEAVTVGFDLIPVDASVHQGQIHAHQPTAQPEFLEQNRVCVPAVRCQQASAQRGAYVGVGHGWGRGHGSL